MVDVWNNERADYNAKVFLQLCEESGNDFSQFDTEMFVRRFYQIFRPFGRLEAGKSISVLQKERTLFRLRVLRTILTKNQSFADFAKTIDLTDFQEAFSGGVKQADAMKKDFLQHVEQGHFTSST